MSIGIIGSGKLGGGFARALARKNIPALISNSRGPESLRALTQELGPSHQGRNGYRSRTG